MIPVGSVVLYEDKVGIVQSTEPFTVLLNTAECCTLKRPAVTLISTPRKLLCELEDLIVCESETS